MRMARTFWVLRWSAALALVLFGGQAATAQYYSAFGKNKVRYGKFNWQIYASPHFKVYYYPESDARLQTVVSLAESAYDRLSRELDYQIQEPTPLIVYRTHSEFLQNNIISNFIPEGVAAFATPARFRMVMPIDLPDAELYELILHELTHIFQYHILFAGSLGKALTLNPPTWLMEGMASYFAEDESASDRMFLRDAVVNDTIPPITEANIQGFFAYRFGHAAFDFMEERWGRDGVMDFLFEFRNTIGARVGKAVERAFGIDAEDFDVEFRRWLRKQYLTQLVQTGEPSDFGRPFRTDQTGSQETSPVASPSGDLVAAFSTHKQDLDVVLFDAEKRRLLRNLTRGYTTKYQNFVGQHFTKARVQGRDLAFSPDGNQLAVFVRREAGFSLALVDVLHGGIDRVIDMDVEQQFAPAWSPAENKIAFAGNDAGDFDIFLLELGSLEITNITNDDLYDGGPSFSPDGKSIVFSTYVGEKADLFMIDLADPGKRRRLTNDEFHDVDPVMSTDGKTVFYTSDRTGAENIFALELATGAIRQYTNAVTGCFMPNVLREPAGKETLIYTGFWKGRFDLFESSVEEPIATFVTEKVDETTEVLRFEPDIQVTLDDANRSEKRGFKLFLEDADTVVGIDNNQTILGQIYLNFSDFLGDRRLIALLSSVESFQDFNVWYVNNARRLNWTVHLFDDSSFFIGQQFIDGTVQRGRRAYQQTGAEFSISYPTSLYRRFELGLGYVLRDIDYQSFAFDSDGNPILDDERNPIPLIVPREDDFPRLRASMVSDTAIYGPAGASGGHRLSLSASYAPDLDESGTLTSTLRLDARKYLPITRRMVFATRLWGQFSDGNFPDFAIFGGLDTVRGFDIYDLVGDQGFFANFELRFPLIDLFVTPVFAFQGIQGRIFLDVAGAWFKDVQSFRFWNSDQSRLEDAVSAYGFGITVRFFGLDLHWDFAKRWDFKESGESSTSFWIGQRF